MEFKAIAVHSQVLLYQINVMHKAYYVQSNFINNNSRLNSLLD